MGKLGLMLPRCAGSCALKWPSQPPCEIGQCCHPPHGGHREVHPPDRNAWTVLGCTRCQSWAQAQVPSMADCVLRQLRSRRAGGLSLQPVWATLLVEKGGQPSRACRAFSRLGPTEAGSAPRPRPAPTVASPPGAPRRACHLVWVSQPPEDCGHCQLTQAGAQV